MPKRQDIKSILIIGAGPIVIGQACEFDYSGTQACKALKEEGYRVILVNSNPATIMTDPGLADATYVEPITPEVVAKIIAKERPDALLPTMGGQTALNTALSLKRMGVLDRYNVEMIGAKPAAIDMAEDRALFREAMARIGLETPRSMLANATDIKDTDRKTHEAERAKLKAQLSGAELDNALDALENQWNLGENDRKQRYMNHAHGDRGAGARRQVGLPAIIRPSFTLGGTGGGIAYNRSEFFDIVGGGLDASPTTEVLIEESVLGWKEYEMEVVRDKADNCIIICSIENIDPMGVHTGDSITVAPALTLTDKEYQIMRNASIAVLREIGVETGGSNVQFAVNPKDGRLVVIEMNPRVSRSSALASKATGFPIAKVAAKLAIGYTLDELDNDITGGATPASFEPSIDYVVTKIPRFAFEKFPGASPVLTTAMKSVGEVMAIGRTFAESLQKALRGLETGLTGLDEIEIPGLDEESDDHNAIRAAIGTPTPDRLRMVAQALRLGMSPEEVHEGCKIDPWFIAQFKAIVDMEARIREHGLPDDATNLRMLKAMGFSDARLATLTKKRPKEVAELRNSLNVRPVFKRIDTCAAEFASPTAYMYSTYETPFVGVARSEAEVSDRKKVVILGGGPNRIGQGIEFDYCCCHAAFALKDAGYEAIMINCNPETVSTDYDTSDRLYFEPLTAEDVIEILQDRAGKRRSRRRYRAVRRPDTAEACRGAGKERHPDPRHRARHDRPCRGPRPLPEALDEARPQSAEQRHCLFGRAGAPCRLRDRLPAGRAPLLRARRPRHADHAFGRPAAELSARHRAGTGAGGYQAALSERQDRPDQHAARQEPASVRQLSEQRHRSRRRLPFRRQGRLCRRHHGAYRGSRHPFRRLAPARCRRARCSSRCSMNSSGRRRRWPRR